MDTAPDRPSPPDTSAVSEAAIGRLAALAGLDLAVGATWRCETRDPWTAETVRAALAAGAPQGAAILSRAGGRARAVEALWLADGRPLIRAAGAPDGSPVGPVEQAARAVRFCDGAATRLGVGRGAVAVLLDSATGAAIGAALPVAWLGEGWRPAGPLVGARLAMTPPRLSAAAARFGWSVLVAAPAEGGSLAVALPPAPGGGALLEMLYALDDAAASQGCGLRLEARWTPPDARLDRKSVV